jgi:hypothetical protein
MKKLDILPENKTPTEAHRKRLVGLFSDTMSAQAIADVEDLLSDGESRGEGCGHLMGKMPAIIDN